MIWVIRACGRHLPSACCSGQAKECCLIATFTSYGVTEAMDGRGSLGLPTILTASCWAVTEDTAPDRVTNKRAGALVRQWLRGLLAACVFAGGAPAFASTGVTFDCGASHSFAGFGLNVSPLAARL